MRLVIAVAVKVVVIGAVAVKVVELIELKAVVSFIVAFLLLNEIF